MYNKLLQNRTIWSWGSILLLLVYLSPLLFYEGNLNFLVFDNLDSNVIWFKILAESGKIFAPNQSIIPNIMDGLPRSCYGSEFKIILWFYYFFEPIQAYIINEIVLHLVAFISMYIFLDRYLFRSDTEDRYTYVNFGALYFAILPFWPSGGLSIPIMPLVTYVLLQIEAGKDTWKSWLLLLFLPLYSSFILVYFFYFFLTGIYLLRQSIITHSFNMRLFLAIVLSVTLFLLFEYRLILQMFIENSFISNRTEYYSLVNKSFIDSYRNSLLEFLDGVPHAKGVQLKLLLPLSLFTLPLLFIKNTLSKRDTLIFIILFIASYYFGIWNIILKQIYTLPVITAILLLFLLKRKQHLLPILLLSQVILAVLFGFSFYKGWSIIFKVFPGMEMFNFSRFFFMTEILWGIISAVTAKEILNKLCCSKIILMILMLIQFNISMNASFFTQRTPIHYLPFHKYYAKKQFSDIQTYINRPVSSYRVVSLGIEPAIAQYNGFYTLDGYMVNYPLSYKHKFRKIIQVYLDKEDIYKKLYDGWGSKLYLFDNGVTYAYYNELTTRATHYNTYKDLDLNTTQIKKMGGEYLLSAQMIETSEKYGLIFLKKFTDENSLWSVHLYRIEP